MAKAKAKEGVTTRKVKSAKRPATTVSARKRKPARKAGARRIKRAAPQASIVGAYHRILGRERMEFANAEIAGDVELSMAMKLASRVPLSTVSEREAAVRSGLYGNVFGGNRDMAARFDVAYTTDDNAKHWAMADGLAADAAANPMIRYILRNRSRYEAANNSYCRGMIDTIATDLVGTGPRLQVNTGDAEADEWIEEEFARWSRAVRLPEKLRTMTKAKTQDGEAFALMISNPRLGTPVKMDLRPIEADQVRFVDITLLTVPSVDGIRFDDYGNPVSYHVLRVHPGFWSYATGYIGMPWEYDVWDAKFVLHWFRSDRPGQHRGIPETMAALPLFAQLRRYKLAVLSAAETAADFAMWMKTPMSAEGMAEDTLDEYGNPTPIEVPNPFDLFPLQRNIVTTLPDGYDIGQTRSEQPTTTFEMFERTIVREIGRALRLPYNVVSGDSSQGNYSANNLDSQNYFRSIDEQHKDIEYAILDRIFAAWMFEARDIRVGNGDYGAPYMPSNVRRAVGNITGQACDLPSHTYNWVRHEWANPEQQAAADETNLRMGNETFERIWGRKGLDFRKGHIANARALGMSIEQYRKDILIPNLLSKPGSASVVTAEQAAEQQEELAERQEKSAKTTKPEAEDDEKEAADEKQASKA